MQCLRQEQIFATGLWKAPGQCPVTQRPQHRQHPAPEPRRQHSDGTVKIGQQKTAGRKHTGADHAGDDQRQSAEKTKLTLRRHGSTSKMWPGARFDTADAYRQERNGDGLVPGSPSTRGWTELTRLALWWHLSTAS